MQTSFTHLPSKGIDSEGLWGLRPQTPQLRTVPLPGRAAGLGRAGRSPSSQQQWGTVRLSPSQFLMREMRWSFSFY